MSLPAIYNISNSQPYRNQTSLYTQKLTTYRCDCQRSNKKRKRREKEKKIKKKKRNQKTEGTIRKRKGIYSYIFVYSNLSYYFQLCCTVVKLFSYSLIVPQLYYLHTIFSCAVIYYLQLAAVTLQKHISLNSLKPDICIIYYRPIIIFLTLQDLFPFSKLYRYPFIPHVLISSSLYLRRFRRSDYSFRYRYRLYILGNYRAIRNDD